MPRARTVLTIGMAMALGVAPCSGPAYALCVGGTPNRVLQAGEECDDGPVPNHGCCTSQCTAVASPPGNPTSCDDGNICTCGDPAWCPDRNDADHCNTEGVCVPGASMATRKCNDGNECTVDACRPDKPVGEECKNDPVPAYQHQICGTPNPDPCARRECGARGECRLLSVTPAGTACGDDGDCCTDDRCDGQGACRHPPKCAGTTDGCDGTVSCDSDTSQPGSCACVPGTPPPDGAPCNDGTACTSGDHCEQQRCIGTPIDPAVACDDGNDCTADGCAPTGCTHTPAQSGTFCETDCRMGACNGAGACVASFPLPDGRPCPGVGGPCADTAAAACLNGFCITPSLADGTPCDDGNPCTDVVECRSGTCTPLHCNTEATCIFCGVACNDALPSCGCPSVP